MKRQAGFTLVELIVVIIILGILSATALPKFTSISDDAEKASIKGIAASVSAWGQANYAAKKLNSSNGSDVTNTNNATCSGSSGGTLGAIGSANILSGDATLIFGGGSTTTGQINVTDIANSSTCGKNVVIKCQLTSATNSAASAVAYIPCTN